MRYDPGISIATDPDVYPPSEDSILLIESLEVSPGERILEIGCGSGVVSLHCAANGCEVVCGDINQKAVDLAHKNAITNGLDVSIVETDVYSAVEGRFDTIVFNLPYLPVDEDGDLAKAWSGGDDGMGPLPALLEGAPDHLDGDGRVIVVVSSLMDRGTLADLLSHYSVSTLGEVHMFFETLSVLEIRGFRASATPIPIGIHHPSPIAVVTLPRYDPGLHEGPQVSIHLAASDPGL